METPLVGRQAERATLRTALAAARGGAGGFVSVTGEAGAGKTRLLDDIGGVAAATGMTLLRGAAVQGGGPFRPLTGALLAHLREREVAETPALRPYRAALHRLLPEWPAAEAAEPVAVVDPLLVLSEGVLRLLLQLASAGTAGGVLLILDDLHWADPDTLAVLGYLLDAVRTERILVVTAMRTDELPPAGLTAIRRRATQLPLGPLAQDSAAELVRVLLPDATAPERDRITALADGVPLLVEELCQSAGQATVAVSGAAGRHPLAAIVSDRMERLDPPSRRLLESAAVIGTEFDWRLLAAAWGDTAGADAVAELLPAIAVGFLEVVPSSDDRLRWRHTALRDAVLGTLLPAKVAAVARRAAAGFAAADWPVDPDGEQHVDLLVRAGQPARAAVALAALADRAVARSALRTAEELLRRAETLGGGLPVRVALVRLLDQSGRPADALELGDRVLAEPGSGTDRELCLAAANAALTAGRWDAAVGYLDRLPAADPAALAARADALFGAGDPAGAERAARAALAAAGADPGAQAQANAVIGQCLTPVDPVAGFAAWRRTATFAAQHGLSALRVRALVALALAATEDETPGEQLLAVRDLAIDAGLLARAAAIDILSADEVSTGAGPAAGFALAEQAVSLSADLRLPALRATGLTLVAALAAENDDADLLRAATDGLGADGPAEILAARMMAIGLAQLHRDDFDGAYALLDEGTAMLASVAAAPLKYWGLWAVLAALNGRWDDEARARFESSSAPMRPLNVAGTLLADAVVAGRVGRPDQAWQLYREALAAIPRRDWWAALLAHVAQTGAIADGWGQPAAELRRLAAQFEQFGATALSRICRDRLRRLGEAVPRRGRGAAAVSPALAARGVTSRELDVLGLIREGNTNAQIAERLYLSVRTVETHVAHLLTKTGAGARGRLPATVDRLTASSTR